MSEKLAATAMKLFRERHFERATPHLLKLAREVQLSDAKYEEHIQALAQCLEVTGELGAAGYAYLYLHQFDRAQKVFSETSRETSHKASRKTGQTNLALCLEQQQQYSEAAELYLSSKLFVHAATNREHNEQYEEALLLWRRLLDETDPSRDPHAYVLMLLSWVQCAKHTSTGDLQTRRALIRAFSILEGLTQKYEGRGMLEDALDAYCLMIHIGQMQQTFENILEGYLNAIRLLIEQRRPLIALRYYAGITEIGKKLGEHHAVATLYREAAELVQRSGFFFKNFYTQQSSEAWMMVARNHLQRSAPPEMTENALLAALDGYNQLDDTLYLRECYKLLANLDLETSKTKRYARLQLSTAKEQRGPSDRTPPSQLLLRPPFIPKRWREELLDWEQTQEPLEVLSQMVWSFDQHEIVRRKVLNILLDHAETKGEVDAEKRRELELEILQISEHIQPSKALHLLQKIFKEGDQDLRLRVIDAAGSLRNPKGLALIEMGLSEGAVMASACAQSIMQHDYPEAFETLQRILNTQNLEVQRSVLMTMGKLKLFEVAEFLYRLIVKEPPQGTMKQVRESLNEVLNEDWRRIFQNRLRQESSVVQERVGSL